MGICIHIVLILCNNMVVFESCLESFRWYKCTAISILLRCELSRWRSTFSEGDFTGRRRGKQFYSAGWWLENMPRNELDAAFFTEYCTRRVRPWPVYALLKKNMTTFFSPDVPLSRVIFGFSPLLYSVENFCFTGVVPL